MSCAPEAGGWSLPEEPAGARAGSRVGSGCTSVVSLPGTGGGATAEVLAPMLTVVASAAPAAATFAAVAHDSADALVAPDDAREPVADNHCVTTGTPRMRGATAAGSSWLSCRRPLASSRQSTQRERWVVIRFALWSPMPSRTQRASWPDTIRQLRRRAAGTCWSR